MKERADRKKNRATKQKTLSQKQNTEYISSMWRVRDETKSYKVNFSVDGRPKNETTPNNPRLQCYSHKIVYTIFYVQLL